MYKELSWLNKKMSSPNLKKKKTNDMNKYFIREAKLMGQNKKMFSIINQGITNYEYNEMPLYLEWPTLKCLIIPSVHDNVDSWNSNALLEMTTTST